MSSGNQRIVEFMTTAIPGVSAYANGHRGATKFGFSTCLWDLQMNWIRPPGASIPSGQKRPNAIDVAKVSQSDDSLQLTAKTEMDSQTDLQTHIGTQTPIGNNLFELPEYAALVGPP